MTSQQVTTTDNQIPAFLKAHEGPTGTEGLGKDDLTLPRIKLGQGTSQEVKDAEVKYGDLFLNITKTALVGQGQPIEVVVLARSKEFILWRPRKDGGGILNRARPVQTKEGVRYQWETPNETYNVKLDGKTPVTWEVGQYVDEDGTDEWGSENPDDPKSGKAATVHYNYVVALPEHGNVIAAFSLSRTSVKVAKVWNSLIAMLPGVPVWGRKFAIKSVIETKNDDEFQNLSVVGAGYVSEEAFPQYDSLAKTFAEQSYSVEDQSDEAAKDERV